MADPKERLRTTVSDAELERRWKAVREMMREQNMDYLLMRNDEGMLGGYVKWFTDLPARNNFPFTVIFPAGDEMTLISHGDSPCWFITLHLQPGVRKDWRTFLDID